MKRGLYRQPTGSPWWNRYPPVALGRPHARADGCAPKEAIAHGEPALELALSRTAACEEELTQQQVSCQNLWPMRSLHWGNPFLTDYIQWKPPTVEQFLKNCSLWEGPMLEMFMKNCLLWEGPHTGSGKECKEEGPQRRVL